MDKVLWLPISEDLIKRFKKKAIDVKGVDRKDLKLAFIEALENWIKLNGNKE